MFHQKGGDRALHCASMRGHLHCVQWMVKQTDIIIDIRNNVSYLGLLACAMAQSLPLKMASGALTFPHLYGAVV